MQPIAEELGLSLPRLALAWCLKNPNVSTVITGASNTEQILENLKAGEVRDQLAADLMDKISAILAK